MTETRTEQQETDLSCQRAAARCRFHDEIAALREEVGNLAQMVQTDELTGLYNFRHFSRVMEVEMERTRRSGHGCALIILDLDNFKLLNDQHGHEYGNLALSSVGAMLRRVLRKPDVPCRFGGEEFTVVLPDTSLMDAIQLAERLRQEVEALSLSNQQGQSIRLSASFGVADYQAGSSEIWTELLSRADSYLLRAKSLGKNQVCHPPIKQKKEEGLNADEREALRFAGDQDDLTQSS